MRLLLAVGLSLAVSAASAEPFDWDGFYAGIRGGVVGGHSNHTIEVVTTTNNYQGDGSLDVNVLSSPATHSGISGSVVGGWNYTVGSALIGIEGALSASSGKSLGTLDMASISPDAPIPMPPLSIETAMAYSAALSVRAGVIVLDRVLLYGAAGAVAGIVDLTVTLEDTSLPAGSDTRLGGLLSIGTEIAITPHLGADLSYTYVNFGEWGGMIGESELGYGLWQAGLNWHF